MENKLFNQQTFNYMAVIIVTEERRKDMLCGALEGGSNYWYVLSEEAVAIIEKHAPRTKDSTFVDRMWIALKAGAEIPVNDAENEDEVLGKISLASIEIGEQSMADDYMHHFADILDETDDGTTADVWFQLAVMNDVVYG